MSSYDGLNLFGSGVHRFCVSVFSVRAIEQCAPGLDGARVCVLGRNAKRIMQTGRLVASSLPELNLLIDDIDAVMDGRVATLVDDLDVTHESMVLVRFDRKGSVVAGRLVSVEYEVEYVETSS